MIQGFATLQGTESYANCFPDAFHANHFQKMNNLFLSSIGLGTYLGEMDDATDHESYRAMERCLASGVNVIDSAINYRGQRSERVIGKIIRDLIDQHKIRREEVFLSTKGGFLPFDGDYPHDPAGYFAQNYIQPGILKAEEVVQGCHVMTPQYLEDQLGRSLRNLGVETVDLYYVHNPETQLEEISQDVFYRRLTKVFEFLEQKVSEGKIKAYGTATWNGYRISPHQKGYLSLARVIEAAIQAGGQKHHFKAIQLPYNLGMPEAFSNQNQSWEGETVSAIEFADRARLLVFTSASLWQGRLAQEPAYKIRSHFPGCSSPAAYALQFVRSTPAVTTALVGMKSLAHVTENLAVSQVSPLSEEVFRNLFQERP